MPVLRNTRLTLIIVALLIGGTVFVVSSLQRRSADAGRARQADTQLLLTGMLDMETGWRGFAITAEEQFLEPYLLGHRDYERALERLRRQLSGQARVALERTERAAERWRSMVRIAIGRVRTLGRSTVTVASAEARKGAFDSFRANHALLDAEVERTRHASETKATYVAAILSLLLVLLLGFVGDLFLGRRERADRSRREAETSYRQSQAEFTETLQIAESESEAHDLLRRHLERSIPDAQVVVLNRNNSRDRLEPSTRVDDPGVAERIESASPKSCLAVRLNRETSREPGETPLLSCDICGASSGATSCRPLLVGHEVIGSVLVTRSETFSDEHRDRLRDSLVQASPSLANLRNLKLAEARAETDPLTGLPNRRAIDATLKRMIAQSSRTLLPLSALMIDLDHFKTINDLYGHDYGDQALAATGALLRESLRESDFAGRQGGEEFIVLAPATDAEGAVRLAENLRKAVEGLEVPGLEHRLSASIGVATFPAVANNATTLVRMADRALYSAKERGRNRVELAAPPAAADTTRA